MRAMTTTRMLLSYFAVLALTCASVSIVAPQASAQAAAQMPKQYTPPGGEPVPQSSTLQDAPPAPALPSDWTKQLAERHESITTDRVRIHVFRLRPGDDLRG